MTTRHWSRQLKIGEQLDVTNELIDSQNSPIESVDFVSTEFVELTGKFVCISNTLNIFQILTSWQTNGDGLSSTSNGSLR